MKKESERRKFGMALAFAVLFTMLAFVGVGTASATTIYVPDNYAKIQLAIDNAKTGDIIVVRDGLYYENIKVNKSLTIKSENGSANCRVRADNPNDHAIEVKSDYVNISGFNVGGATGARGIYLNNVNYCNISNNDCSHQWFGGIFLNTSFSNLISNNRCSYNSYWDIRLDYSSDNIISGNDCENNEWGGISISHSNNNSILSNKCDRIAITYSKNNNVTNNDCISGGICLADDSNKNVISNNDCSNSEVFGIWVLRSEDNTISNNDCNNCDWDGISIQDSNNNNVSSNECINNNDGITLKNSNNNIVSRNNCKNNNLFNGMYIENSSDNTIYLNNLIGNTNNVYSPASTNIWNSTEKIIYVYDGTTYQNYLGNYWSDYKGDDANNDGIGDSPYNINSDKDDYPLMQPWENYSAPTRNVFDTGQSENPYPSIFGTHIGKIKPNHDVIVNIICTYSCPGTGGHTEYVRFENESWNVTAKWDGYKGDWHNITFDEPFTLYAGLTYNYTIITGSYPQIHHTDKLEIDDGVITCTSFIDANGKEYTDWIPAIRLE
jgi:parallel beta-helix repeat protein